jgi:hypothetical protein
VKAPLSRKEHTSDILCDEGPAMKRADVDVMAERVAASLPGATCRPVFDGPRKYVLRGVTVEGRAFEIRTTADLRRVAPKREGTRSTKA